MGRHLFRRLVAGTCGLVWLLAIATPVAAASPSWMPPGLSARFDAQVLPHFRIVAYYGSPLTPAMGILGEQPQSLMISQLLAQAAVYAKLDPAHPVIPALEMVAVVAARSPGPGGTYSRRMPYALIQQELNLARSIHGLLILDVQVGHASVQSEVQYLAPFLAQPDVELALDPEFDMPPGDIPGIEFGTMPTSSINWTLNYLNTMVKVDHLPQKVLIVHQFLKRMIPQWNLIAPQPYVALVRDMDGFGGQPLKIANYERFVRKEAVSCTAPAAAIGIDLRMITTPVEMAPAVFRMIQRTLSQPVAPCGGFKIFYKADKPPMTPQQTLTELTPAPLVVIYQ
ncbi:MAG: hypothetical protein ACYCO4_02400 [Sulfobacillus sp.]